MERAINALGTWVGANLKRRFAVLLAAGLVAASFLFLVAFAGLYRAQLEQERSMASEQINSLLQAALENAMLKRDLPGLRDIVHRLGEQSGVHRVMIVNPENQVRFSSDPSLLGRTFRPARDKGCRTCHGTPARSGTPPARQTAFMTSSSGDEVLRSVNPVRNKRPCTQCHGPVAENPVNGVLFVDYDAATLRAKARQTVFTLVAAGAAVMLLAVGTLQVMLRRHVLEPVRRLAGVSARLSGGDLEARVPVHGRDELADLGHAFNSMADSLQDSLRRIRRHEAFQQALIDAVPDGIRVIDQDFRIVTANQAYCDMFGETAGCVGRPCHLSSHGREAPCPPTLITCPLEEIRRHGRPVKVVQRHPEGDDGFFVETSAAPLRLPDAEDGRLLIVEAMRDLTQDIAYSHEQKLAAVGQLAANVAHEIRNPLSSVRLALQGLLRRFERGEVAQEEVASYLRLVDGELDTVLAVTGRLLRMTIYADGALQPVAVGSAVRETAELLRYEAEETGVAVNLDLPAEECWVMAREGEVRMIALNLLQNAFHAMPDGGPLDVLCQVEDGAVVLEVADAGVGIPADDLPHIFDPFYSRRADDVRGSGLGLTIAKTLTERYAGRISVSSEAGQGSRFRVELPALTADGGGSA